MRLNTLSLHHFRNYSSLDLECHPNLNIFLGANAQGKTNILEAIYFLATTRSHRTHHDRELIKWDADSLSVRTTVDKISGPLPLEVTMDAKGRTASVNHLKETRLADYIGQLKLILFAPENLELIKGAPAVRRRFLTMEIAQIRPLYIYDTLRYNRVLRERNTYLRHAPEKIDLLLLDVLDTQLVQHGTKLMEGRAAFLQKLQIYAQQIHSQLTHQSEILQILYQPKVKVDFLSELTERRPHDLFRHQSTTGPHRDDIVFTVNDVNVADFGSQGQQRTVALSVKLAEIELIHEETGEYPILLLDDVMSELDNTRQLDLLSTSLDKTQTFLTTTTLDHLKYLPEKLSLFDVDKGKIRKR